MNQNIALMKYIYIKKYSMIQYNITIQLQNIISYNINKDKHNVKNIFKVLIKALPNLPKNLPKMPDNKQPKNGNNITKIYIILPSIFFFFSKNFFYNIFYKNSNYIKNNN